MGLAGQADRPVRPEGKSGVADFLNVEAGRLADGELGLCTFSSPSAVMA